MRIWILEIGEPLPLEKDMRLHRYGQFSKFLADQGEEVVWWASSFSHTPKKQFAESDTDHPHGRATLRLIRGPGYQRNISLSRVQHNRHFAQRFLQLAPTYPQPDLILAPVPTVETALAAVQFGKERKIPVIVDIRDLWPDELRDLAPTPLRPLAKLLLHKSYKNMEFICRNSAAITGVSQSYIHYGLSFAHREKNSTDFLFPLGYSLGSTSSEKLQLAKTWYDKLNLPSNSFKICFFGTIGKFFDLATVIEAAKILQSEMNVDFLIGGDGSDLAKFKKLGQNLTNLHFLGWLNQAQIATIMQHSQAGLAPYAKHAKMSLPNKPYEYMAGGLPVISSIQGELKELLQTHNCGVTYTADSVSQLCEAVRKLAKNSQLQKQMAMNAKKLLTEQFATEVVFQKAHKHLKSLYDSPITSSRTYSPLSESKT